jgi:putative heme-binding domain-containing protein
LEQLPKAKDRELRKALIVAAAMRGGSVKQPDVFLAALFEFDDADVVNSCALGLAASGKTLDAIKWKPTEPIAGHTGAKAVHFRLLELMQRHSASATQLEYAMSVLSAHKPVRTNAHPRVIWSSTAQVDGDRAWFAREFDVTGALANGELVITCDNEFAAYLNGKQVAASKTWGRPMRVDVSSALRAGKNLITVEGKNLGGPAGLVARLTWKNKQGQTGQLVTDQSWRLTRSAQPDWQKKGASQGTWGFSLDVTGPAKNVIDAYHSFTQTKADDEPLAVQQYWHKWYLRRYSEAFVARELTKTVQRPDVDIHKLIVSLDQIQGDVSKGRALYLKAGCYACHGGIADRKTTIFGPPLNGVTLRLKRAELADAIVYPSKQVVERFKASRLVTTDGKQYSGFITEQTDDFVSFTDLQNKITRLPISKVDSIEPQKTSLMPTKLLNGLSDQQVKDLLAFLQALK